MHNVFTNYIYTSQRNILEEQWLRLHFLCTRKSTMKQQSNNEIMANQWAYSFKL